jgi:hypothetical protein
MTPQHQQQQNKSLHPTGYSAAVSLVPRFTLALPPAGDLKRCAAVRKLVELCDNMP